MDAFFVWLTNSLGRPGFWLQPCLYALYGGLVIQMACWLLFQPSHAWRFPGSQRTVPLTPGLLPRLKTRLSEPITQALASLLAMDSALYQQAETLLHEDRLIQGIDVLLQSVERELQNKESVRRIYRYGEEVLPEMLAQLTSGLITSLDEDRSGKMARALDQLWITLLSHFRLNYNQAEFITDLLFTTLLTPYYLRIMLVDGLRDSNIQRIQTGLRQRISGLKGLLVRFMGIDQILLKIRLFCEEHPEQAEAYITDILDRMEVREKLAERISNFAFDDLPEDARQAIIVYFTAHFCDFMVDNRDDVTQAIATVGKAGSRMLINRLLQMNLKQWLSESRPELKQGIARFSSRYLRQNLATFIQRLLPIVNPGDGLVKALEQTSGSTVEHWLYRQCRRELWGITAVNALGGFAFGILTNIIQYSLH